MPDQVRHDGDKSNNFNKYDTASKGRDRLRPGDQVLKARIKMNPYQPPVWLPALFSNSCSDVATCQ
jgi:hypothetical protein